MLVLRVILSGTLEGALYRSSFMNEPLVSANVLHGELILSTAVNSSLHMSQKVSCTLQLSDCGASASSPSLIYV